MRRVYLDHNATTPVAPEVVDAMLPFLREQYGNPSSFHTPGQAVRGAVEEARGQVAAWLGARPSELVFTSGGTESANLAVLGVVRARAAQRCHVVTSAIEHHAVFHACRELEREGVRVTYVPADGRGVVDPEAVRAALTGETVLVSVIQANNETGVIQPVAAIAAAAHARGILMHTDAVQGAGKLPVCVADLGADLVSLAAHKCYGPKGVGVLYVRRGVRLHPVLHGGHHERLRRAGTENVPGIVGCGQAAELARQRWEREAVHVRQLRDGLEARIRERIAGIVIHGEAAERLPNTTSLACDGVEGEALVMALDLEGVAVSTGAACTSGSLEPSHVLRGMGVPIEQARATIRISWGRGNTVEELEQVAALLPDLVERIRRVGGGTGRWATVQAPPVPRPVALALVSTPTLRAGG